MIIFFIKEKQSEGQTGGEEHDKGEGGQAGAMLGLTDED